MRVETIENLLLSSAGRPAWTSADLHDFAGNGAPLLVPAIARVRARNNPDPVGA